MSIHDRGGRNGYTSAHSYSLADGNEAGRVLALAQQDQVLSQVPPIRHATSCAVTARSNLTHVLSAYPTIFFEDTKGHISKLLSC